MIWLLNKSFQVLRQSQKWFTWLMSLGGGHRWFCSFTAEPFVTLVCLCSLALSSLFEFGLGKLVHEFSSSSGMELAYWGKPPAPCSPSYRWVFSICVERSRRFVSASDSAPSLIQFYQHWGKYYVLIPNRLLYLFLSDSRIQRGKRMKG